MGSSLLKLINKTSSKTALSDTSPPFQKNYMICHYVKVTVKVCSCVPVPVNPPTVFLLALRDFTLPRSNTSSHHAGICICLGDRISNEGNSQNQGSTSSGADVLRLTLKQEIFWIPHSTEMCMAYKHCNGDLYTGVVRTWDSVSSKTKFANQGCKDKEDRIDDLTADLQKFYCQMSKHKKCLQGTATASMIQEHPGGLWHRMANCLRQTCLR